MKQTKPEHNGASQLIPGVIRALGAATGNHVMRRWLDGSRSRDGSKMTLHTGARCTP